MNRERFHQCHTTPEVHAELRKLLICEYLTSDDGKTRFRLSCRIDIPHSMRQEIEIEKILDYLEDNGKFCEGDYGFIKNKLNDIDVAITDLIGQAESRIREIRDSALQVTTLITNVEPVHLEQQTRAFVDLILLTSHEKLLCRSEMSDEEISSLLDRHTDLGSKSEQFLQVWHNEYCRCRKYYGQQLLLRYVTMGAQRLEKGEARYERFRLKLFPNLLVTLKKNANTIRHVFKDCGGSQVSIAPSSVHSYWLFDSVTNLDKLWEKYNDEGLHVLLQESLNTKEVLELLSVEKISLNIIIQESDYMKYRRILERQIHGQTQSGEDIDMRRGDIPTDETKQKLQHSRVILGMRSATKMSSSAYVPTQETTNLARVSHVLRCPCTDQLRDLLRHHVPPASFPRVIQEKRTNLPRLTAPQRKLILPSTGHYTGDYSDMDVSLLYLFLRNICNIQPHIKGWGHTPDDADISLSACIDSIREIRNKIGHSSSSGLSQVDFIDYWSDIKRSVKSIDKHLNNDNKYEKDVDCLLEASMDPEREAIYLDQLKSKVKTEGIEDLRSLVASINELEADRIQILSLRMDDAIDLDRIYASVSIIDEYDKRGSMRSEDSNFQCIETDKIFTTQSGNLARFIFMLGEAGYGKTVQCQRFAKSWCQAWNNDTVRERDTRPQISDLNRCLKQFDFLFFIKMRDVSIQSENLIDLIQDVYSRYRLSKQILADMRMILENGEFKSLVLVDGLDEWNISDDKKKLLLDKCIPNCRNMPGTTILISMRSWKFMEVEEVCNPNIDRVIRLNGLDEDGVKELTTNMLSNYFQNKTTFDDFNERKAYVENAVSYAPTEIKSLMNIPMLTVFYILTLYEDVKTGNYLTTFYLSIIEALFRRMSRKEQAEGIRGEFSISTFVRTLKEYMWNHFRQLLPRWLLPGSSRITDCISLQEYPKVVQHLHELTRLGKVAFESLSSEESILVFSEDQLNQQLDEEIVDLFLRVGLVIKSETTGRFHEEKIRISFLHKTIHEFLASLYLIYGRKETDIDGIMKDVLLINVDKAIEYTPVLIFLGGLSPAVGCRISSLIKNLTNDDDDIKKYRFSFYTRSYQKMFHLYNLQLRCYKEVRGLKSIEAFEDEGQTLKFSFSDVILLSTDTDVLTIRDSAKVMKFHPNDIISLNMVCIPNNDEEGISNALVKTFLDESQSMESLFIDGYDRGKCRHFMEYSQRMSYLQTLGLRNVSFRDNILADLITKEESKERLRALGLIYIRSAEDKNVDFQYRIPSIHGQSTTETGYRRQAFFMKSGENSNLQRKQRSPLLKNFLEILPEYKKLKTLHITYMKSDDDRQMLLQVLPELKQLQDVTYSGSVIYSDPNHEYDANVISTVTNLENLQDVELRSIYLTGDVLNFKSMSSLEKITLEVFEMPTASDWDTLFKSFTEIKTLQKISLYDTNVPKDALDKYKTICGSVRIENHEGLEC